MNENSAPNPDSHLTRIKALDERGLRDSSPALIQLE